MTRTFEHDVAGLTAFNPYAEQPGQPPQQIANYLADPTEEAILHMVNADPARTPTLAEFAKPDYYLSQGSATCTNTTGTSSADCVTRTTGSRGTTATTPPRSTRTTSASPGPG